MTAVLDTQSSRVDVLEAGDSRKRVHQNLSAAGDSQNRTGSKLSAGLALREFDIERRRAGVSQDALAQAAGITSGWYRKLLRRPASVRPLLLPKLRRALRALERQAAAPSPVAALTLAAYAGFLEVTARHYGVTPDQVRATSPQRGATADAHWRSCAHARQAAIYLVNVGLGVEQARIAALLVLTPAAVCLALKDVEDRRDDEAFEAMISAAMRGFTGRDE
jgi:transcriptional regulator with XRE-family HTH domain